MCMHLCQHIYKILDGLLSEAFNFVLPWYGVNRDDIISIYRIYMETDWDWESLQWQPKNLTIKEMIPSSSYTL